MRKYGLLIACVLVALMVLPSCKENVLRGEGAKTTEAPVVASFDAVDIDVSLKAVINVQQGVQPSIQMSGYANVLQHIKTVVVNNKLRIYTDLDDTWTIDDKDIALTINMPAIVALSMSGSQDADVHGNIVGKEFKVGISGASSIKLDSVDVDDFSIEVSGAGDVAINGGAVKHASYDIKGAGDLKAFALQAAETEATISGAGTSEVTALQKLTANINGAGSIKYKGHPAITQDVSGVGTISDAN